MKQYSSPVLRDLGSMAVVTRKSGVYTDVPDPTQTGRATDEGPQWLQDLCDALPFLFFCQPN